MNIKMLGIDYTRSTLEYREKLAFSETRAKEILKIIKDEKGVLGVLVLSTCNRTEIWVSYEDSFNDNVDEILCNFKGVDFKEFKKYFVYRQNKDAIKHIFMLTSGLKSKILGEEQIITQVKNAFELARKCETLDTTLEILFRDAITASKKIKTQISFKNNSFSVVDSAINKIKSLGISIKGKKCLVIGNGEMGKLSASTLFKNGADVTMTLRQHHKGDVVIPVGVKIVNFLDRVEILPEFDIIFSTTSTNRFMLKYEDIVKVNLKENVIFIDLAVPRDIDEKIYTIDGVIGFNVDDFEIDVREREILKEKIDKAQSILDEYINNFYKWYFNKDLIGLVFNISKNVADNTIFRVNKMFDDIEKNSIHNASKKSVQKLLFCLRDNLESSEFKKVLDALENNYLIDSE